MKPKTMYWIVCDNCEKKMWARSPRKYCSFDCEMLRGLLLNASLETRKEFKREVLRVRREILKRYAKKRRGKIP